jgi:hypothetical protein
MQKGPAPATTKKGWSMDHYGLAYLEIQSKGRSMLVRLGCRWSSMHQWQINGAQELLRR